MAEPETVGQQRLAHARTALTRYLKATGQPLFGPELQASRLVADLIRLVRESGADAQMMISRAWMNQVDFGLSDRPAPSPPAPKDGWQDDPEFPRRDWQYQVANNDTHLGYLDWVEHEREMRKDEEAHQE